MIAFLVGVVVGGVVGGLAGGLLVFKHYRPVLRDYYEFLDLHAPRDQTDAIATRLARDQAAAE